MNDIIDIKKLKNISLDNCIYKGTIICFPTETHRITSLLMVQMKKIYMYPLFQWLVNSIGYYLQLLLGHVRLVVFSDLRLMY